MATIHTRIESARGCGYRQPGGLYFVSDGLMAGCQRLPIELMVCPTCHAGIKPARGWTWINPAELQKLEQVELCGLDHCHICPANGSVTRAGLLWIGEKFYPSYRDFMQEANAMGVSRRISQVPNDFEVGKTWIFLAHRKVFVDWCDSCAGGTMGSDCEDCEGTGELYRAGMFHAFRPKAIEYVVKGDETEEELDRLEKRGLTLVKVVRSEGALLDMLGVDDQEEV